MSVLLYYDLTVASMFCDSKEYIDNDGQEFPSKHFLKTCKQIFDKMSSVSSKNVKTNL